MKSGCLLLADGHLGMLGGVYGALHGLFNTVVMVADERSLMEAIRTLDPELVVVDLSRPAGWKQTSSGGCWRAARDFNSSCSAFTISRRLRHGWWPLGRRDSYSSGPRRRISCRLSTK
ncbi:MAG: hypothetical protein U0792_01505 [Gemmataceae bacterium]